MPSQLFSQYRHVLPLSRPKFPARKRAMEKDTVPPSDAAKPTAVTRRQRIFDILCHTERAEHTAARVAKPRHNLLDAETARLLQQRALASLKSPKHKRSRSDGWPHGIRAALRPR